MRDTPLTRDDGSIRGTVLEVSASAVVENARILAGRTAAPVIAVVKANAYGIGAGIIAPALARSGVAALAVVTVEEGLELRALGISTPILVLGGATWLRAPELLFELALTPLVSSDDELRRLQHVAERLHRTIDVHVALDTGMAREGFFITRDGTSSVDAVVDALSRAPLVRATSAMTHFAHADLASDETTPDQVHRFTRALTNLRARSVPIHAAHVANSAAALTLGARPFDLSEEPFDDVTCAIRPGIALLGVTPFADGRAQDLLTPVFRWRAPIVMRKRVPAGTHVSYGGTFTTTRETELAVLGIGYADGYPRALSNSGCVRLHGQEAPILGRVCMDLTVVDVTDIAARLGAGACALGTPVTVLGGRGQDHIPPWDVAERASTIAYDVMNRISARVPRVSVRSLDEGAPA
jgi:alanine racemase